MESARIVGGGCCAPLITAPLTPDDAVDLAKAFKALGDPVRLRLLSLITSANGESCVCDLTTAFELTGPTISHHLKVLREAGLVDCERRGTWGSTTGPASRSSPNSPHSSPPPAWTQARRKCCHARPLAMRGALHC